jgi:hypothetical protein
LIPIPNFEGNILTLLENFEAKQKQNGLKTKKRFDNGVLELNFASTA